MPEITQDERRAPPSREANRSSYSFSNDNYDLVWKEAKRMNLSMTGAVNVLLEELQQWRSGARRFVERRKQQRETEAAHRGVAGPQSPAVPAKTPTSPSKTLKY